MLWQQPLLTWTACPLGGCTARQSLQADSLELSQHKTVGAVCPALLPRPYPRKQKGPLSRGEGASHRVHCATPTGGGQHSRNPLIAQRLRLQQGVASLQGALLT